MKDIYKLKPNSYHRKTNDFEEYFDSIYDTVYTFDELFEEAKELIMDLPFEAKDYPLDHPGQVDALGKIKYFYYHALIGNVEALLSLIALATSEYMDEYYCDYALEYLTYILNCTEINSHKYTDRYKMVIADCHIGVFGNKVSCLYSSAMTIYHSITHCKDKELCCIAEHRINCLRLLMCTKDAPPKKGIIKALKKSAESDPLSKCVLSFYYLTTSELVEDVWCYDHGKRLIFEAIHCRYSPAFRLLNYYIEHDIYKERLKFSIPNNPLNYEYIQGIDARQLLNYRDIDSTECKLRCALEE